MAESLFAKKFATPRKNVRAVESYGDYPHVATSLPIPLYFHPNGGGRVRIIIIILAMYNGYRIRKPAHSTI